jgi:hypothetical protein
MSEALIFASTNPQYDNRLFIELWVQYMKIPNSEHVAYKNCFLLMFWHSEQFMYTTCSELGIFMYWTCNSMSNLLSYYGLFDARISASEKDLPVTWLWEIEMWKIWKRYRYVHWQWEFHLWPLDLVKIKIHGLHSLQKKDCQWSIKIMGFWWSIPHWDTCKPVQ